MGYVPSGLDPEEYRKLREKEKKDAANKKLAAFGPQSFKSRSMASFLKDYEAGKADHLLPVLNAKEKIKKGVLKEEDIPYMQRGGAWDNSDLKTAKKKQWNEADKKYDANANQNANLDWAGQGKRSGGPQSKAPMSNKNESQKKKGGFFGLF